jgi:hypothetical protein
MVATGCAPPPPPPREQALNNAAMDSKKTKVLIDVYFIDFSSQNG